MRGLLSGLDVELVDAAGVLERYPAQIRDGWQLKAYAVAYSRFEEVLFLDADQAPVRNPELVFAWPSYLETGAVFWPDILDISADNPIWTLVGRLDLRAFTRALPAARKKVDGQRSIRNC